MNSRACILLVEDDGDILELNRLHLEAEGYAALCAPTLARARRLLRESLVDLVILDVMLPDGSGFDFCSEIREAADIPILFLTCLGDSERVVEGLMRGGDDYIVKPYDMRILLSRVATALRRCGKQRAGRVRLSPLSINLSNDNVTLGGEPVSLSRKEVQLLAFFASQPGREFTQEEIYEAIWGAPFTPDTATVKVHISHLRKKLGEEFEKSFAIEFTTDKKYVLYRNVFPAENA